MNEPKDRDTQADGGGSLLMRALKLADQRPGVVFGVLVVIAAWLRFQGADAGLPYCWHPDEPKLINKGIEMLQSGDLNPHWFHYPSLPMYIQAVGAALGYLDRVGDSAFIPLAEIPTGLEDNLVHTVGDAHIWSRGRKITGLMGALAVGFTFLTGRRLFGTSVGLLAAVMLAFSPVSIVHGAYITVDVPTSMAVSLLMLASAWVYTRGDPRDYLLAAVALGLAIGFKYNAAVGAVTPLTAWLISERRQQRLGLGLALVPLAMVVFVLTMPFALVEPQLALTDMAKEVNHYMQRGHGTASIEPGPAHLLAMFRSLGWDYLPIWLLGLLGLPFAIKQLGWRPVAVVAAFPLAYMAYMSGSTVFFKRNLVVLVPGFALLSAVGLHAIYQKLGQRFGGASEVMLGRVALGVVLVPAVFGVKQALNTRENLQDSRSEMAEWLHGEQAAGWVVAVPQELRIAESDLDGLEWVSVKFNDGPEGWAKAGATHVLGGTRLKVSGTRNTPIKGKATDRAVAWYKEQTPVQTFGYTGWMLDLNAQDPELSLYALDGVGAKPGKGAQAGKDKPPEKGQQDGPGGPVADGGSDKPGNKPSASASVDDPERWQIAPAKVQDKVEFPSGQLVMKAAPGQRSVKACDAERTPVDGLKKVKASWRYVDVSREDMAGQLQVRFFAQDGSYLDGTMQVVDQAVGSVPDWKEIEVPLEVPDGASKLRLCVELGSEEGLIKVRELQAIP